MEVYEAPQKYPNDNKYTIFLGGSIEMNLAKFWQKSIIDILMPYNFDVRLLNPRRISFDVSQDQSINNPYFKEQVNWEMDGLDRSDLIVMYLQPDTKSPISMMEIGSHINTLNPKKHMVICCPVGFWRKGNIEVITDRYPLHSTLVETYEELENFVISRLCNLNKQ